MPPPPPRGRQSGQISRLFGVVWILAGIGIAIAAAAGRIKSGIMGDKNLPYWIAATTVAYGVFRFLYGSRNNRA